MGELDLDTHPAPAVHGGLGIYMGPRRVLGPGELFGEISFFTEIPQMETVRWERGLRWGVKTSGGLTRDGDSVAGEFALQKGDLMRVLPSMP